MRSVAARMRLACAWVALLVLSGVARAESAYFVVAVRTPFPVPPNDAYVLPLTDPTDIATARSLVNSTASIIVNARIEAGADGINRNVKAPGMPLWSWHVVEFLGFSESSIEICDGSPTQVEQHVAGWIANTGGMICFWAYTVVDEIPPLPVEPSTWGRIKALYRS